MLKFICLPFVFFATAHPTQPQLTASNVSELIRLKGPSAALQQIYDDPKKWLELLHGIATGAEKWLNIAKTLRPVSDASASEQLELAVGEALEHRPENVLRVTVPAFSLQSVCGGPDVDDSRYDSCELSIRAINRRKQMVSRIAAPNLVPLRDQCVEHLESSKAGIAYFYGKRKRPPNSG